MTGSIVEAIPLPEGETACGIYFLILNGRVIYVGQSVDVARRVRTHRKTMTFDEVKYIVVEAAKLDTAERRFILDLKPPENGFVRDGKRDLCAPSEIQKRKPITGSQLQKLLDSAGLSQRGAAKEIGISERQMRRYVAGEADVPLVVEFALRWVIHRTTDSATSEPKP